MSAGPPTTNTTLDHLRWPLVPRLANRIGGTLRRFGVPVGALSETALLAAARRETGLSDFGDDGFREPLRVLIDSAEREDGLTFVGRLLLRQKCARLLANRLKIQADLKRHPEILDVEVKRPLFITGLPRTGSTLLHRLLAQDPSARSPTVWEMSFPSPPPELATRARDPRIRAAEKLLRGANYIASIHPMSATEPEECTHLLEHGFISPTLVLHGNLVGYKAWLRQKDKTDNYRYFRKLLQLLQWHCDADHWVLKSPVHLPSLGALLTVFPDARIVLTHRDPLKVLPSECSLMSAARLLLNQSERLDLHHVGKESLDDLGTWADRAVEFRERADPARVFDVHYHQLLSDPIAAIQRIYAHFEYPLSATAEERMRRWLVENPQNKHGVHKYSLAQFGLDPGTVNERFAAYRARFGIEEEKRS